LNLAPISIVSIGMMTGLGLTSTESCAALRARSDNFRETGFISRGEEWVIGSEVPLDEPWRGIPRLARLAAGPLRECLGSVDDLKVEEVPVLLCVAEPERPGRLAGLGDDLLREVSTLVGARLNHGSRLFSDGRVGAALALRHGGALIREHGVRYVAVCGVDSLLASATLAAYIERGRLLTTQSSNGFIPGEAGAALLLTSSANAPEPCLSCHGIGVAREPAPIESGEAFRADGLTEAFRQALGDAGVSLAEIGYRIADMSGEQYWFRQADLASSRLLRGRHEFQDIWHPADGIGEVGAAMLPCMLGVAFMAARKGYAPGDPVLAHAANDDGRCTALVLSAGRAAG